MVSRHQHRPFCIFGINQRAEARKTTQQVVQSGRGNPGLIDACDGGWLNVIKRQLVIHHPCILPLRILCCEGLGEPRLEVKLLGIPQHNQRHHVFLWIDTSLFVGLPIEVNRQTRHDGDRAGRIKERGTELSRCSQQRYATRYGEIAVKPGIEERATIDIDPQLHTTIETFNRVGFD